MKYFNSVTGKIEDDGQSGTEAKPLDSMLDTQNRQVANSKDLNLDMIKNPTKYPIAEMADLGDEEGITKADRARRSAAAMKYFINETDNAVASDNMLPTTDDDSGVPAKLPFDDIAAIKNDTSTVADTELTPPEVPAEIPAELQQQLEIAKSSPNPQSKQASILEEYKALVEQRQNKNQGLDLLAGANKIGQAIASGYGGKIDDGSELVNQLRKTADMPVNDFKSKQERLMDEYKLRSESEKTDPTSSVSAALRNTVKKLAADLGVDLGDIEKASAGNLTEIMRSLTYLESNKIAAEGKKEAALSRQETATLNREDRNTKATEKQEAADDKFIERQVTGLSKTLASPVSIVESFKQVEKLMGGKLESFSTDNNELKLNGKVIDLPGVNFKGLGRVSVYNSDARSLESALSTIMNVVLRDRSGAAVTDSEFARLQAEFSDKTFSSEAEKIAALKRLKEKLLIDMNNMQAGVRPEAVDRYEERGGFVNRQQKQPGPSNNQNKDAIMSKIQQGENALLVEKNINVRKQIEDKLQKLKSQLGQ